MGARSPFPEHIAASDDRFFAKHLEDAALPQAGIVVQTVVRMLGRKG